MKVKSESEVAQSCPALSEPMDCSLPGSSAHGIFQARVLEWGAIALSEGGKGGSCKTHRAVTSPASLGKKCTRKSGKKQGETKSWTALVTH